MHVEQVMFRSGQGRCAGDLYGPDGIDGLAPTPLLLVTGVDDRVHAIDEVLKAYDRAWQPKRLELLAVDEFGLSIEPGLGQSMGLAAEFLDQHLRRAPRFVPSPACRPRPGRPGSRPAARSG